MSEHRARHLAGSDHRRPTTADLRRGGGAAVASPLHGTRHLALPAAILIGMLISGLLVWRGTAAAFTASTATPSNTWTAGQLALTDDDSGTAMFNASNLVPGSTGSNCIAVTYTSTLAGAIKLYTSASTDASTVAQHIDLVIQEGTGGGFGSCGAFVSSSTIYTGTLSNFTSTKTNYSNGVGVWAPSSTATRVYRITYTLNAATPNSKQGATTTATFQWESQA